MKKPLTSNSNKTIRTTLKNATSNVFFAIETHHKHTVDFKKTKSIPINVLTTDTNINSEENLFEDNPILNKYFNVQNTSSYNIKTPSQVIPLVHGENNINLEEYKIILMNLFEFITLLYSKRLSCLIPKIEKNISIFRKYTVLDSTANLLTVINQKNRKVEILLDMVKKRIKFINEFNFHYNILKLFNDETRKEINICFSIEMKFLLSLWLIILKMEDDHLIVSEIQNMVSELYQVYLYLTHILLIKIKDEYKSSNVYHDLSYIINNRLFDSSKKLKEQDQFRFFNQLMINILNIFIKNGIKKDPSTYVIGNDEKSELKRLTINNNKYFFNVVLNELLKNILSVDDYFHKSILFKIKEFSKGNFGNNEFMLKPKIPYLPPLTNKTYTLVVDLDETLIHCPSVNDSGSKFLIRPGAVDFLKEMKNYYEIIIFTAAVQSVSLHIIFIINKVCR